MLVLGLGPAGSTYVLTSRSPTIRVYDLYLAKYGRTRSCCAGGLGFAALEELGSTLPQPLWETVKNCIHRCTETDVSVFTYVGEGLRVSVDKHDLGLRSLGVVMDRYCFDTCLASEALRWAAFVKEPKVEGRVVYATGYSDPPPVPRKDLEVVIQQWINAERTSDEITISIVKRYSRVGYFWIFPEIRSGVLKVGVGESLDNLLKRGVTVREVLEKYKERLKVRGKVVRECGAVLPLGKWREKYMRRGGNIYIGTAGGFINPLTGAGIKMAILSGYALATGRMDVVERMKKEINRSYMLKQWLRILPQRKIDSAVEFLYGARGWIDREKMFGFRNLVLAVLALL